MPRLKQEELVKILSDMRNEPAWRQEAVKAAAYYDCLQLTAAEKMEMEERGQAPLFRNLIAPAIDLVLGMEAKNRQDLKLSADNDEEAEAVEAMQVRLKGAERSSKFDTACSNAYAGAVKTGLEWIEVSWESDPFRPRYRVRNVHRNELWWDWRSRENDLSDARYVVRRRWVDEDLLTAYFPEKTKALLGQLNAHPDWLSFNASLPHSTDTVNILDALSNSGVDRGEWFDAERRRYALYEVWYRRWVRGTVLKFEDERTIEYDPQNMAQVQAVAMGLVQPQPAVFSRMRLSWWCGPIQLNDIASPYPHNDFPYTPVWGLREDATGMPYGLIRRMMSPQDEVNARLSKMMWLLSAKQVIADSDAADMPWADVVEEASRPDSLILMNPRRTNRNADALRIISDFDLSQQQFNVLADATQTIKDSAGISNPMLGSETGQLRSGSAVTSLIEQGSATLAEINDNYTQAKISAGEKLLSLVITDIGDKPTPVTVTFRGDTHQMVLNEESYDPHVDTTILNNSPARLKMRVGVSEVPDTPSYRAMVFQELTELTKSLPPELQALVADQVIRNADIPNREELADRIARFTGVEQSDPKTPEETEQRQKEAEEAEMMRELEMAKAQQELEGMIAQAEKDKASAMKLRSDAMSAGNRQVIDQSRLALDQDRAMLDSAERMMQHEDKMALEDKKLKMPAQRAKKK